MQPIQDVLHRILWDADFGRADFVIGYADHLSRATVHVPWQRMRFGRGEHFALDVQEEDGSTHMVPLHRVREVWRNGELIWRRSPPTP